MTVEGWQSLQKVFPGLMLYGTTHFGPAIYQRTESKDKAGFLIKEDLE
jgi:hypothetical protein